MVFGVCAGIIFNLIFPQIALGAGVLNSRVGGGCSQSFASCCGGGVAVGVAGGSRRGCRGGDVALGVAGGA